MRPRRAPPRSPRGASWCAASCRRCNVGVLADLLTPAAELMHWRTYRGDEVDLVVEHGRRVVAIEAKATRRPAAEDVRGLRAFLRGSPEAAGLLVHGGAERRQMERRIWALPWTDLARGR